MTFKVSCVKNQIYSSITNVIKKNRKGIISIKKRAKRFCVGIKGSIHKGALITMYSLASTSLFGYLFLYNRCNALRSLYISRRIKIDTKKPNASDIGKSD